LWKTCCARIVSSGLRCLKRLRDFKERHCTFLQAIFTPGASTAFSGESVPRNPTSSGSFAPLQSGAGSSATTPASACRGRRTRRRRAGSPKPIGPAVQKAQAKSAVIGREVILTKSSLSTALAKGAVRSRDHPISGAADETRTDSLPARRQREHVMLSLCVKFPLHRTCITQRLRRPRVALHLFSHRPLRPPGSRYLLHRR
jgi:hypothetical protein